MCIHSIDLCEKEQKKLKKNKHLREKKRINAKTIVGQQYSHCIIRCELHVCVQFIAHGALVFTHFSCIKIKHSFRKIAVISTYFSSLKKKKRNETEKNECKALKGQQSDIKNNNTRSSSIKISSFLRKEAAAKKSSGKPV